MHTYWAKFEFINQDLFRLDTRVYLSPVDSIQAEDTCVGAIVGKNPGSAQPHITTSCIQPIKLSGDRCLPTVRHIVLKAYTLAGLPLPRRGFIQVLNLFYLCNPNLRRALSAIKAHGDVKCCPAESRTFPWVWYIWGGSSKALNTYKLRFAHIDTSHHFYYDKLNECIVDKAALPNDFAKHTQGLKHKFVVPYIAGLLMECVDTDKVSRGRIGYERAIIMKKSELVERMYTTRSEFEELLGILTPDQMTQSGVAEEWSVKDMLAHIAWYQQEEAELFGETGVPESPLWAVPQDPRNALLFEQNRHKPLDEVLAAFRQAFAQLTAAVTRLSDEELNMPSRFPDTTAERPPWQAIAIHSYEHDREHIEMIQAWLAHLQDDN